MAASIDRTKIRRCCRDSIVLLKRMGEALEITDEIDTDDHDPVKKTVLDNWAQ